MASFDTTTHDLRKSRAGIKSKITAALNILKTKYEADELIKELFVRQQETILKSISKLEEKNEEIDQLCDTENIDIEDTDRSADIDKEQEFLFNVQCKLAEMDSTFEEKPELNKSDASMSTVDALAAILAKNQSDALKPKLHCATFSGKGNDKLEFKNFMTQFNNCVDANGKLSGSVKLTYLRSYLTDYALKIISHLTINDDNYDIALKLLKEEFLDEDYIADEFFKQLCNNAPKYDPEFNNVRQYLNETRAILYELKTYNVDLLEVGTAGSKLASHVIFAKLPNIIKRELVHKVNTNYPSINDLLENYNEIIKTLSRTSYKKDKNNASNNDKDTKNQQSNKSLQSNKYLKEGAKPKQATTLENFNTNTNNNFKLFCKFCNLDGHSMFGCHIYDSHKARVNQCKALKMCETCTSSKHVAGECFGKDNKLTFECKVCKSKSHISALCPRFKAKAKTETNFSVNTGALDRCFLLPIMTITVNRGKKRCKINVLVDTGSQRSYFPKSVVDMLGINIDGYKPKVYDVNTFLGRKVKELKQIVLDTTLTPGTTRPLAVLIDNEFDISFNFKDLAIALSNFKQLNYKLATEFEGTDEVKVQGLIGIDLIQFIKDAKVVDCMYGVAWQLPQGIMPYGNTQHFLYHHQHTPVSEVEEEVINYCTTIAEHSQSPVTHVNFVMNPKQSYFDPLAEIFNESNVERNIDKMFSCESLGIREDLEMENDYDRAKIKEFEESIEFKDGAYNVKLPWHEEKIKTVPSNHAVALSVLDRVVTKLDKQNLLEDYSKVFKEQEKEGIIERIKVKPEEFHKYIWIPHRPIIKVDAQTTTKIRPVLNCSLKTNGQCSLNEAAYPGVNIMGDMLELLLKFRSNKHVLLADIRKAFLMIKLGSMEDRNRFCIFMKEGEELVCYRYKTIIFGYNASPFILNFIIKHHANQFPEDKCTDMLNPLPPGLFFKRVQIRALIGPNLPDPSQVTIWLP